jgi:putative phosphoesterase
MASFFIMTRIGLLSDTHNDLDDRVLEYFSGCDEIWHAGDFGTLAIAERLEAVRPLRGVYGNIDGQDLRARFPEKLRWTCEDVDVYMIHIGGYPGRYAPGVKDDLVRYRPRLFIAGHSHILKIIPDPSLGCLHINPGAAGIQGWHKVRTAVRFTIDGREIKDCQVCEWPRSGPLGPAGE